MKRTTRIITLTLLGGPYRHGVVRRHRSSRMFNRVDTRRTTLVVRPGELDAPCQLRTRVIDSIIRMAGGPVVGRGELADRIIQELHREPQRSSISRDWTIARFDDGSLADPYDRPCPKFRLIDLPVHTPIEILQEARVRPSTQSFTHKAQPRVAAILQ